MRDFVVIILILLKLIGIKFGVYFYANLCVCRFYFASFVEPRTAVQKEMRFRNCRLFSLVRLSCFIAAGSIQAVFAPPQAARLELGVTCFDVVLFKI